MNKKDGENGKYFTPFYEERFYSTFGYILRLDKITPITREDALSARAHYREDLDHYLEWIANIKIPNVITRRQLWAVIVADRESFFTGDYMEYVEMGESRWEEALLQFVVEKYAANRYIDEEGFQQAQREAAGVLQERGFVKSKRPPPEATLRVPPPLESGVGSRYYDSLSAEDVYE